MGVCCSGHGAMPAQHMKHTEQAQMMQLPGKIYVTSKSPVGDIPVVTLIRTDTTLDHSQKAEKVCFCHLEGKANRNLHYTSNNAVTVPLSGGRWWLVQVEVVVVFWVLFLVLAVDPFVFFLGRGRGGGGGVEGWRGWWSRQVSDWTALWTPQPASQPTNQPDHQPASQPASQPATCHPTSQPAIQIPGFRLRLHGHTGRTERQRDR